MVLNIESNIRIELAPILNFVLCLPSNAPRVVQVSQGGDKGVGGTRSLKDYGSDTGALIGKVISSRIPTSIPMKPLMVSLTTTSTKKKNKLIIPLKGTLIKEEEGWSSKDHVKTISTIDPKEKGKVILIEQSDEEKKKQKAKKNGTKKANQ
ncbi:unnamed protein product [Lactuca saligna]|uniref:Uncharacterized protein n=1 Tax=Lactuca saligna TaxID=75948 RepID=A0AA35ZK15_LACSI|nr:unnamed protein product [Lactuca saligna]